METVNRLSRLLPEAVLRETGPMPADLTELRLRSGRPAEVVGLNGGTLVGGAISAPLVAQAAQKLAGHSLYAREEELREGYFTIEGGCRVGVCGRMTAEEGKIRQLTHIGSVCVRIAREIRGAADAVMEHLYEENSAVSALIISPPGLGKTTLLRDIARQLSDGACGRRGLKVGMADERGELAGCVMGVPMLDVGARTDVMDGCPKRMGMKLLIRSMSPEVIVTDELGHPQDAEAVRDALRCGVRVIASVHARDESDARRRLGEELMDRFDRYVIMGGGIGRIMRIDGG